MDEEFAAIAKRIKSQASIGVPTPELTGGPEVVAIKVRWKPHPENPAGQTKDIGYTMKRVSDVQCLLVVR